MSKNSQKVSTVDALTKTEKKVLRELKTQTVFEVFEIRYDDRRATGYRYLAVHKSSGECCAFGRTELEAAVDLGGFIQAIREVAAR